MSNTFHDKRLYSSKPYLKTFDKPCRIAVGDLLPTLKVFVIQRKNVWGDPLPFDLAGYTIKFRLLDKNNQYVAVGDAAVSDAATGEIQYEWKKFDIVKPGQYTGEFEFTTNGKTMTLPKASHRLQIVAT